MKASLPATIIYEDPDHWIWCPSLVKADDGKWHLFASRWPKTIPFHPGWLLVSEIIRAESDSPEGPFTFREVVMRGRGADWWDGRSVHNPTVIRDGTRWVMFYMGSTHPFEDPVPNAELPVSDPRVVVARWRERLGVAIADDLTGPWRRLDAPALDARPEHFDSWITSNPTACRNADGSWYLVYKARATIGDASHPKHGPMTLGMATATRVEGPWTRLDKPILPAEGLCEIEDPFVWRSDRGYELLFKDMSDRITGSLHALVRAWSADGKRWQMDEQPLFSDRWIVWPDGREEALGSLERPSLYFEGRRARYLIAAAADGPGWFQGIGRTFIVAARIARAESQA
jgi:hypothetical protein